MKKVITVIAMTTSDCNLSCAYCYVAASRKNTKKFEIKNVETLIQNCSIGFDSVEFCWHGGEPLLVGKEFYKAVIEAQKKEKQKRKILFKNNIQSNGMLLDESWFQFIKENDFHLGLSFDVPLDTNLTHRKIIPEDALTVFQKVRDHGLSVGVLCVISKLNVRRGEEIFNFFASLGVESYSLLPLKNMPLSKRPSLPDNGELFELYKTTFDLWVEKPNNFLCIEPIDTIIRALLGERPRSCSYSSPCLKRMITVDQEGNVIPCASLVAEKFVLGSILKEPLLWILSGSKTKGLCEIRARHVAERCHNCEFVSICRGGCRADAFWGTGKYDGEYPYCEARKKTFEYIRGRLNTLLK